MLQPIHHSKRRYWEIGLAAPSLEFKANDGPSKEGRGDHDVVCYLLIIVLIIAILFFAKNLLRHYDDNWLSPIIYLIKIKPARRQSAMAVYY
ncbi:Protein of unknown function [Cotesia congregata]|uniref:Uncharacterized protein n=1 Tax=Cotesia congregata TaxID=51543 RepID=A0A8J2H9I4_COTCN|nr:Protein of unknown function [Cotesia congregata]